MLQTTVQHLALPADVQQERMCSTLTKQATAAGLTLCVLFRARMWLLTCRFWAQLCQLLSLSLVKLNAKGRGLCCCPQLAIG